MKKKEELTIDTKRHYIICKSNDLVLNSRHKYNVLQQKLLYYVISNLDKFNDNSEYTYTFSLRDYIEIAGLTNHPHEYEVLKKNIKSLSDESYWLKIIDDEGQICETLVRWFQRVIMYDDDKLKITVSIDEHFIKHLFGLKKHFMSFQLINILNMRSKYSLRLYEYMKVNLGLGRNKFRMPISELKSKCMIDETKYKSFKNLRVNVIEKPIEEINAVSDINVIDVKYFRTGRSYSHIEFTVEKKEYKDLFETNDYNRMMLKKGASKEL